MTASINPRKARLYPELLPESINMLPTTSGTSIASYANFYPWSISLQSLNTSQNTLHSVRVDGDSGHGLLDSETLPRPDSMPYKKLDMLFEDSMDIWGVCESGTDRLKASYNLRVTKLTVLEKIRYGLSLSDAEKALSDQFSIVKEFMAGRLSPPGVLTAQFKKITEVSKKIEVTTADQTTGVGRKINVKQGEKAVLLNIGSYGTFSTENDTYITMNRDTFDMDYIKLDITAMQAEHYNLPCYIPAVDNFEINVDNHSIIAANELNVQYRYGIADLTVLEKIKWEQPMDQTDDTIATEFDLFNAVKAGVM